MDRSRFLLLVGLSLITLGFARAQIPVDRQTAATAPVPMNTPPKMKFKNWGIYNTIKETGKKVASHIYAVEAWKLAKGSRRVVVAVIDTGIDSQHPDLRPNIWKKTDPKTKKDIYGWNFSDNLPNPADQHGHGTHVAGIIGSMANSESGTAGVAQRVSIMAISYYRDSNPGHVNLSNTVRAIHYAIDNGAQIINYSGGGPEFAREEYLALRRAEKEGVLVVAAAGNNQQDTDLEENFYYPSAYRLPNIISVAATNIKNQLLTSSNWGLESVDVAAPGENIYSTIPGNKYGYSSGTSQATAFVTGLAALMLSQNPSLKPEEIRKLIVESVDPLPQLKNRVSSGGKVNAYKTLVALSSPKTKLARKKKKPETGYRKDLLRILASPMNLLLSE